MPAKIHAHELALADVFSKSYLFSIPDYQRPYAWTTDEVGDLIDDLSSALNEAGPATPVKDVSPYFLGSVVLIKEEDKPESDVVDGQQRLTTLTILFSVLRELAAGEAADNLHQIVCQKGNPLLGIGDEFRLKTRERDSDFFRGYIQTPGGLAALEAYKGELSDSQANMRANAIEIRRRLSEMPPDARFRFASFLLQRCFVVVVAASDRQAAFRIFSVMNDRGLDLSPTDILKADILRALGTDAERRKYTDIWEDLEEALGRADFEALFGHIRMIEVKIKAQKSVVEEMQKLVLPKRRPAEFIDGTLVPYGDAFEKVKSSSYSAAKGAETINALLTSLNRVDNADWVPVAIWAVAKHDGDHDRLEPLLRDLERLTYALFLLRTGTTERIQRYGRVLTTLEAGADPFALDSPLQLTDGEKADVTAILDGPVYLGVKTRLPLLLRLDGLLSAGGVTHHPDIITVEHVLPQNPDATGEWVGVFPDPDVRERWVHRLGNLALLPRRKNSQASNFDFARKKAEYFIRKGTATFALTTQILSTGEWTEHVLAKRQDELLGVLRKEWRL